MTSSSFLIKQVASALEESLTIPMWGNIPAFSWSAFSQLLQGSLHQPSLYASLLQADWKPATDLVRGLGENPLVTSLVLAPLALPFFLAISEEDLEKITKLLLDPQRKKTFLDTSFQKGFFHFNLLHLLKNFHDKKIYEGLTPKLEAHHLPQEKAYCIDVGITTEDSTSVLRLICPLSFHHVFTSHFASKPFTLDTVDSSLELTLKLQVGHVQLSNHQWKEVLPGDFIILDHCSYSPKTQQGSFSLVLENTPLFIVKRKQDELKILDYALSLQEDGFMQDDQEFNDDEEASLDDGFFDEEEDIEKPEEEVPVHDTLTSAQDVPLSLHVEIARIKMPLNQLLSLKPGNTLPLSLSPHVMITLNSQIIAKGELLQLGDMVGVKISEISHH